jgi:hypothetical protein
VESVALSAGQMSAARLYDYGLTNIPKTVTFDSCTVDISGFSKLSLPQQLFYSSNDLNFDVSEEPVAKY